MNKTRVMGLLRHALTFGGGYVVAQGWVSEAAMPEVIGAIVTLVGVAWSIAAPEKAA
jgi:hypothetical protein